MEGERQVQDESGRRSEGGAALLTAEASRAPAARSARPAKIAQSASRISTVWRVFGGTILSIAAFILISLYNQLSTTQTELRRDLNQLHEARADLIKKEEFNSRLALMWSTIKELQGCTASFATISERSKAVDHDLDRLIKDHESQYLALNSKIGEQARTTQEERKDVLRQIEQLKAAGDERKQILAGMGERLKTVLEHNKELTAKVQLLAERLATLEGRQSTPATVPAPPEPKTKKWLWSIGWPK
jgi:DNA repair exonuclease SbcCD ATPase subunit